jgi:hypothetical protein
MWDEEESGNWHLHNCNVSAQLSSAIMLKWQKLKFHKFAFLTFLMSNFPHWQASIIQWENCRESIKTFERMTWISIQHGKFLDWMRSHKSLLRESSFSWKRLCVLLFGESQTNGTQNTRKSKSINFTYPLLMTNKTTRERIIASYERETRSSLYIRC